MCGVGIGIVLNSELSQWIWRGGCRGGGGLAIFIGCDRRHVCRRVRHRVLRCVRSRRDVVVVACGWVVQEKRRADTGREGT